jgi:hypothetical protein
VSFLPTAEGARNATIVIANSDADESTYDFALQGTGLGLPEINVQGNSLNIIDGDATAGTANNTDFGSVNTGTSVTKNFIIQNTGTSALTISGMTFSGTNASEFSMIGAPAWPLNVPASGNQSVTVQFMPAAVGTRTATISIANNDTDEGTYDFALVGNGVVATAIGSINMASSMKVYPNPSREAATVALDLKKDTRIVINVTDMQGKEVLPAIDKNLKAGQNVLDINTANLSNGVYFLKVSDETSSANVKLVVMH